MESYASEVCCHAEKSGKLTVEEMIKLELIMETKRGRRIMRRKIRRSGGIDEIDWEAIKDFIEWLFNLLREFGVLSLPNDDD